MACKLKTFEHGIEPADQASNSGLVHGEAKVLGTSRPDRQGKSCADSLCERKEVSTLQLMHSGNKRSAKAQTM
jgi:hypothetical protein